MKVQLSLALSFGLASMAGSAQAQVVVDGTIAGDSYGAAASVQAVNTQFGDNASELDAAYCTSDNGRMYLALTGNIENNFNKIEIFIDSRAGGENVFSGVPGNDNSSVMTGLTFDAGFEADYHLIVRRGFDGSTDRFDLDIAELGTANFSAYSDVFGGTQEGSGTTGTGPGNASPIDVGYNNGNTDGVVDGCDAADQGAAGIVMTGVELGIALSDLGNPGGDVRVLAFVNGSNHDYASNQFLGPFVPDQCNLGGDGMGNFTGQLNFNLNDFAGEQYFTCEAGTPSSDVRLNEIYASHAGTDDMEYVELIGPAGASLDNHAVLVVEGEGSNAGTLDRVWDLTGLSVPGSGYFMLADTAVVPNDFDLGASNSIENGTETFYLVLATDVGALIALLGTNIDPDGDLVTDIPSLATIVDIVAMVDGDFGTTDFVYDGAQPVGPDGSFLPAGIFRGDDFPGHWCDSAFLDFDDVVNMNLPRTPGAMNVTCPPPCTDDCACPTAIAGVGLFDFDTTNATMDGAGDPLCYDFGTSDIDHDVWFAWTPDDTCDYTINACGLTSVDTKMALYDGADCATSAVLDCNDDTCSLQSEVFGSQLQAGQTYLIRVGTFPGALGGTGQISIASSNCAPDCSTNDDCVCATVITDGVYNETLVGATNDGTASCGASSSSPDVWYSYTASCTGVVTASTCGTHDLPGQDMGIDTVISVYDGCGGTELACDDDDNPQIACAGLDVGILRDSAVQVPVVAGQQLLIRVSNFNNGATGPFILRVSCQGASSNDNCADRMPISGTGVFDFDNSAATQDGAGDPLCYDFGTSDIDSDVWFTWTAPCNGDYTVSMCNLTSIDTKIAIYDGPDCGSSSVLDCNDDTCSLQSEVTGTGLVGGDSYLIRIGTFPGAAGGVGQFSIAGPDIGGTNYCQGGLNGDGQNGSMSITGSTSVAANDLVLVASDLTDASFAGLFVMGDTQDMLPFAGGFLCVDLGGTFIRLNPIINGGGDVVSRVVDNTVAPSNVITPGSTWYFQYWYRDQPIFSTNTTDGICVCFAP